MIIGFCGKMGAGKDTAGAYLVQKYAFQRISFADKLKVSAAACFGIDKEKWETLKNDPFATIQIFDGDNDKVAQVTVREFLQHYGTEAHRDVFGTDFWIDQALKFVDPLGWYVVTDVRFENEARAIREKGGMVIQIHRDGTTKDAHSSEAGISDNLIDGKIANMGTIAQLETLLDTLVETTFGRR